MAGSVSTTIEDTTVDRSILGLCSEDYPVTVQTYLYNEKMLSTGSNPYKPYRVTLHACLKTEKLKCLQLDSDKPFYVPVSYPYPISFVSVFSEQTYKQVSDLAENHKSVSWFTNTQPFEIGNNRYRVGSVFQLQQRRSFSIRRRQAKRLHVYTYPKMISLEMPCNVIGMFVACGSPEKPVKKLLNDVVNDTRFPFLFSLAPTLGSMSILAVCKREFYTVISCKKNRQGQKKMFIFPVHLARKVLFLENKDPIDKFRSEELDNIRAFISTNFHASENFLISFVYEQHMLNALFLGREECKGREMKKSRGNPEGFIGRDRFSKKEETYLRQCLSAIMDGYVNMSQNTFDRTSSVDRDGYTLFLPSAKLTIKQTEQEDTDDEFDKQQGEINKKRIDALESHSHKAEMTNEEEEDIDCYENSHFIKVNEITKTFFETEEDTDDEFDKQQGEIERKRMESLKYQRHKAESSDDDEDVDCYENCNRITVNGLTKKHVNCNAKREPTRLIATSFTMSPADVQTNGQQPLKK